MLGLPLILTPILIAFLEMVIDPACSVVFEAEEEEEDVMQRPPRDPASPLAAAAAQSCGRSFRVSLRSPFWPARS